MHLLLFGIILILYFGLHSFLAHNKVKTFLMEKWISKRIYRLFFNFIAIGSLLAIFLFYKKLESHLLFEIEELKMVGGVFLLIGLILSILALMQYNLGEFSGWQQYKNETAPSLEKLKTSGFNSYVRHPLYFATLVIIWGCFLFQSTDLILIVAIVSSIYVYVGTKLEEEKLIDEFGVAYLKYQKKVGMLIPFLK